MAALVEDTRIREELIAAMTGLGDMERLMGRIVYGSAGGRDLASLRAAIERLPAIRAYLEEFGGGRLKELAEEFDAQAEYRALYKQAQLGQRYEKELQDNIVRLGLSLELGVPEPVLRNLVKTAAAEDLMALKTALEARLNEMLPVTTQLMGNTGRVNTVESGFLI